MLSQLFRVIGGKPPAAVNDLTPFIVHSLLVWRVASFLTFRSGQGLDHKSESGPFNIFDKFRAAVDMQFNEKGAAFTDKQTNEIAKLFTCMFCSTTWIGIGVALLTGNGIGYGLALSAAAVLLERKILY